MSEAPAIRGRSSQVSSRLRFAILCLARTGSSHLVELLDSHPDVRCFGEVLNLENPRAAPDGAFAGSESSDPVRHVRELLDACPERAAGLKLPMNSLRSLPESAALLDGAEGMRIVRLRRENLLDLLISRRMLRATLVSQSSLGSYGEATVRIEPDACLRALVAIEREGAELDALGREQPSFSITYEQLTAGTRLAELQRFLGVEPATLRSPLRRLRTRSRSATVENWDELAEALRPTRFASFLGG